MIVCAAGDIHGAIDRVYKEVLNSKRIEVQRDTIAALQRKIADNQDLTDRRIENALIKYRSMIYTRYEWKNGTGFRKGIVSDVYDDGRFTIIRMKKDNQGLMAVTAEIDGKKEMLEYKPEGDNMYKIVGVYVWTDMFCRRRR